MHQGDSHARDATSPAKGTAATAYPEAMSVVGETWRAGRKALRRWMYRPRIDVGPGYATRRLGTTYGGWTFVDTEDLLGSTAVCCGLGEDASFDVAFANAYGARVVAVDPTPRAIEHFAAIQARFGLPAEAPLSGNGRVAPESYDLSTIDDSRFSLIPKAVAAEKGRYRFFAPPNPAHVSYSLVNFQNEYASDTAHIEVEAVTLSSVVAGEREVSLVKLDIEGAEVQVIPELLAAGQRPKQILIEFDELNVPSPRARASAEATDRLLRECGYQCVFHDGRTTFSYLRVR